MKNIWFCLALSLMSTFLASPLFFLSELATRILVLAFSPRRHPDSWVELMVPNACSWGYSNDTSISLLCPAAPIYKSRKQVYKAEDKSLSITLNKLLFLQLVPEEGREKGGRERRDKLFYDSNTNPLSNACKCVFASFFIFFPFSLPFFLFVAVKCKSGVYPALLQHETHA